MISLIHKISRNFDISLRYEIIYSLDFNQVGEYLVRTTSINYHYFYIQIMNNLSKLIHKISLKSSKSSSHNYTSFGSQVGQNDDIK